MVDFGRKIGRKQLGQTTDPLKIYEELDRTSEKVGELRSSQKVVLRNWYNKKLNNKDVILKLNTGAGKTLVGLLMLDSRRRMNHELEVYLCNTKYLVTQTLKQAKQFGIPVTVIDDYNRIPSEAKNGEKILITTVSKVFNGKTIFKNENGYERIDGLVIDDSHSSIEIIKRATKVLINKQENLQLYKEIFGLFENSIREQGEGTFEDIINYDSNENYDNPYLHVPYWEWIDRKQEILKILSKYKDDLSIKFVWPLIKDDIEFFDCIISAKSIEIYPERTPIEKFESYCWAAQRIFMSATSASDELLINGFGIGVNAIEHPLVNPDEKWSGEKMVIIPNIISEKLDRSRIVQLFGTSKSIGYGICAIVPSNFKTKDWEAYGANKLDKGNLQEQLSKLHSNKEKKPFIIVNGYDGIDLPDSDARILILDSLPKAHDLSEQEYKKLIPNSFEINQKIANKIEQGMGRAVRADTDYAIIVITGTDLINFVINNETRKFLSKQAQQQLLIGKEISVDAKKDINKDTDYVKALSELMSHSLNRDTNWKIYYKERMENVDYSNRINSENIERLSLKAKIYKLATSKLESSEFNKLVQKYMDKYCNTDDEKGYYMQLQARTNYLFKKSLSKQQQQEAYKLNNKVLLPNDTVVSKNIKELKDDKRTSNIINWLNRYNNFEEMRAELDDIIDSLDFGVRKEKFESNFDKLGKFLGFTTDRPDQNYRKGPDHLWGVGEEEGFFVIEDKSEVKITRNKIYKQESGQLNNSMAWFNREYPQNKCYGFLIIPTLYVDPAGGFNGKVRIIRKKSLRKLCYNLRNYVNEFSNLKLREVTKEKIVELLNVHKLNPSDFLSIYSENYKVKNF